MALEDIAMFRAIPGLTLLYPSDPVAAEHAIALAAQTKGIFYVRLSRPAGPMIYSNDTKFEIGKSHVIKQSSSDKLLVVAGGITTIESLKAHAALS